LRWNHKDGTVRFIESNAVPVLDEAGAVTGFRGSDRDVTEIRRAQENLQKAYENLEMKIQERTGQLAQANQELRMEITERRHAVELIRKSKELSDALNALGTVIHSTLNISRILQRVVEEAAKSLKVEASMIGVFEEGVFKVRHLYNMPAAFSKSILTSNELQGVHYAAAAGDAVAFNDAFNDERLNRQFVRKVGIRSLIVSPVLIKDRIAGAMVFYGLSRRIEFGEEHVDFARKLGASVSLALENAQLYEALQTSERRLNALLNGIPDMAWLKDKESRFILVNEAFARSGGTAAGELIGKTDFAVWPRELAEKYRADDREVMINGAVKRFEEPLAAADGTSIWLETIKTPVLDEQSEVIGTVGIARDVTERKRMEDAIKHMAQHDALTGLPNRRLFIDIVNLELAQARRHGSKVAILFLDLDRFKEINDTFGHDFGDILLQQVAARFKGTIRGSDSVARIGGDEFNMVLSDFARSEDVSDIANKIVNSLRDPVLLEGHELHVTTSIGISIYPDDSIEVDTLLRFADIAMYHAKESGRNTFRFYNPSINIRSIERMKLDSYLRQTIKRGELSVLYQPQIDIRSGEIRHAEALVRWNHPDKGLLEPKEFIPLAEETGFITTIDEWVLSTVCRQASSWKAAGVRSFCVTVNLSSRQFQSPDLLPMISRVLGEAGLPPNCLDLEVTEGTAMKDVERSVSLLRELRAMGIHISIDDFGTGYSSLNYLKKLPIERLKIDKSFVRDIAENPDDRAIISAVTSMARKMGIRTVAEGVETEEQLEFLRASDCDEAQGYLFSRPVPAERFRELVEAGA
jgi:diguanylate cyclase (GGDEF)-like protein/PAS domain S-box-containing protein